MSTSLFYFALCAANVIILKEVNSQVTEPYMVCFLSAIPCCDMYNTLTRQDEPFHVPQAQAYCRGDYWTWDPKITTTPGL